MVFGQALIVGDAPPVFHDPPERALDHPAAGQHLEGMQVAWSLTICRVRRSVLATQVTSSPAYPPSAQIKVTARKLAASRHSSGRAPSRSWTEAAVTTTSRMRPSTSTARCLLVPVIDTRAGTERSRSWG